MQLEYQGVYFHPSSWLVHYSWLVFKLLACFIRLPIIHNQILTGNVTLGLVVIST